MTPEAQPANIDAGYVLTFACLLLAPLAIAGVALVNAGLGRSRSAAQAMLGNLATAATAAIAFAVIGACFAGALGGPALTLHTSGKAWSVIGFGPWALGGSTAATPQNQLTLVFEFFSVAFIAILPWGSGADRLRIAGGCAAAAFLGAFAFPLLAHWAWNGGWLNQLGVNFGLGAGFRDPGGAATVHVLGGLSALAIVWITGQRRGKFPKEGLSTAMPGHNAVYVLFGCMLALVGWLGWNAAGALLWMHAPVTSLPETAINTLLAAAGAVVATFTVTRVRFGKPDASLCANGWLGGLVTSSACAAVVSPGVALFVGIVAGIITPLLVEAMELALSIDDPSGAVSVHGAAGLWGIFAAGLLAGPPGQLLAQLMGIAALLGVMLPLIYFVFALLNRVIAFRVDPDGERMGMDLHELGGSAYPEFVIHRDESYR